jgi:hypothetical protein
MHTAIAWGGDLTDLCDMHTLIAIEYVRKMGMACTPRRTRHVKGGGIHCLCDTNKAMLQERAAEFGIPPERCYTSVDEMLGKEVGIVALLSCKPSPPISSGALRCSQSAD